MMKHLEGGVKKGAFTQEVAIQKFEAWKKQKEAAVEMTKNKLSEAKKSDAKARLEAEIAKNKAKAEEVSKKKAEIAEAAAAKAAEEAAANAPAEEATETPAESAE